MMEPVITAYDESHTFQDKLGNSYDIGMVSQVSRNANKSSVQMDVDGRAVIVEITPTEAIKIIQMSN